MFLINEISEVKSDIEKTFIVNYNKVSRYLKNEIHNLFCYYTKISRNEEEKFMLTKYKLGNIKIHRVHKFG